jgi:hypothetical protein
LAFCRRRAAIEINKFKNAPAIVSDAERPKPLKLSEENAEAAEIFLGKDKNSNDSKEIDSSWPFGPPGKKRRGETKRRRRAQRMFLEKPWVAGISQEAGAKRASFLLASRP